MKIEIMHVVMPTIVENMSKAQHLETGARYTDVYKDCAGNHTYATLYNTGKRCERLDHWRDTEEKTKSFALYTTWFGDKYCIHLAGFIF